MKYYLKKKKSYHNYIHDAWEIFFFEALHYIRQGCWDISSHTNTSPVSMRILNKKDCFPINCGKVRLKRYRQYPYLLVF